MTIRLHRADPEPSVDRSSWQSPQTSIDDGAVRSDWWRRPAGISFGLGTHALFGLTVWYLYWFLAGDWSASPGSLWINFALLMQFAVVHSLLLHPVIRRRLARNIKPAFYGLFFTVMTCLGLLVTFAGWRSHPGVLWHAEGLWAVGVRAAFIGSWVALFYSLALSGLGFQTGWTPWWHWLLNRPQPRREFHERGLYRWFRHPIYLSFLGLIWFTPRMTVDHAMLTGVWTVYIFVGSWLKDRRLEFFLGDTYREYESRVPGYPGMNFGPLGIKPSLPDLDQVDRPRRAA